MNRNDELRINDGKQITVYVGELTAITPGIGAKPNEVRFTADSVSTRPLPPPTMSGAPSASWSALIDAPDGSLSVVCKGTVPAYLGGTFGFDLIRAS
jgi:hypothetical protein